MIEIMVPSIWKFPINPILGRVKAEARCQSKGSLSPRKKFPTVLTPCQTPLQERLEVRE